MVYRSIALQSSKSDFKLSDVGLTAQHKDRWNLKLKTSRTGTSLWTAHDRVAPKVLRIRTSQSCNATKHQASHCLKSRAHA